MFKKITAFVALALMLMLSVAFADQTWNLGQNRSYSPNPSTIRLVSANYTAVKADHMIKVDTTSGAVTITLPDILDTLGGNSAGYIIQNIGTTGYAVTVTASTTDAVANTIEGVASRVLPSAILGTSSTMSVSLKTGYDWKVTWETPPVAIDMLNNLTTIGKGMIKFSNVVTAPTVSATLTVADCGKVIPVATDALTFTLGAAGAMKGCDIRFINTGAAAAVLLDIKAPSTDAFYGYVNDSQGRQATVVTSSTGSTLSNTKASAQTGDSVRLISINTGSWLFTDVTGTWTTK